jgi:hypothetical protein
MDNRKAHRNLWTISRKKKKVEKAKIENRLKSKMKRNRKVIGKTITNKERK